MVHCEFFFLHFVKKKIWWFN